MADDRDERLIKEIRGIRNVVGVVGLCLVLVLGADNFSRALLRSSDAATAMSLTAIGSELSQIRTELEQNRLRQMPPPVIIPAPTPKDEAGK